MTALELLSRLRRLGVTVAVEDDRLRLNAPRAILSAELRRELTEHKDELIKLLRGARPSRAASPPPLERASRNADLTPVARAERVEFVRAESARLQASLDLNDGPLLRVALFRAEAGEPSLVFIAPARRSSRAVAERRRGKYGITLAT